MIAGIISIMATSQRGWKNIFSSKLSEYTSKAVSYTHLDVYKRQNMLRLNVFIQVSADNRAAVMEAAKELVACSLKDNGCICLLYTSRCV